MEAVAPRRASSVATSPFLAAKPTCSGLVIEPKLEITPAAIDAAMPRACAAREASSCARAAPAAAAATVPNTAVGCQPFA